MADNPVGAMLLDLGLDLSPVQNAAKIITATMGDLNRLTSQVEQNAVRAAQAQQKPLQDVRSVAEGAVKAALAGIEGARRLSEETAKQVEALKQQVLASEGRVKSLESELSLEAKKLELLEKQNEKLREQAHEKREAEGKESFGSKITKVVAGGGTGGVIAAALVGGEIGVAVEAGTEAVVKFVEKLRDASTEAGNFVHAWENFQRIAAGKGVNADAYLDQLRDATGGLVNKLDLATFGARALGSGIKGLTPDKIIEITEAVSELAEANKRSAKEGVEALSRVFSRGGRGSERQLSAVTGISPEALMSDLPTGLSRAQRTAEQLMHSFAVLIEYKAKLGEVPQTLEQAMGRVKVVTDDLLISFGKGLNESGGAQTFIKLITGLALGLHNLENSVEGWGARIGTAMAAAAPALMVIRDLFVGIFDVVGSLLDAVNALFAGIGGGGAGAAGGLRILGNLILGIGAAINAVLTTVKAVVQTITPFLSILGHSIAAIGAYAGGHYTYAASEANKATGEFANLGTSLKNAWVGNFSDLADKTRKEFGGFNSAMDEYGNQRKPGGALTPPPPNDENRREEELLEAAKTKFYEALESLASAHAKRMLDTAQRELADQKELEDNAYRDGLETLQQHLDNQLALEEKSNRVRLDELDSAHKASIEALQKQKDEIQFKVKKGDIPANLGSAQINTLTVQQDIKNEEYQGRREEQLKNHQATVNKIQNDGDKDIIAARKKQIQETEDLASKAAQYELETAEKKNKDLQELNKKSLGTGARSPEEYQRTQIDLINDLRDAQIDAAMKVRDAKIQAALDVAAATPQSEAAQAEALKARVEAIIDALHKMGLAAEIAKGSIDAVNESQTDVTISAIQRKYGPQQGLLSAQLQTAQQYQYGIPVGVDAILRSLKDSLTAQKGELQAALPDAKLTGPDEEAKINLELQQVDDQLIKVKEQLITVIDLFTKLGTALSAIATGIGSVFGSKFGQNLAQTLGLAGKQAGLTQTAQQSVQAAQTISGAGGYSVGTQVQAWTNALVASIPAITNFVETLTHSKNAVTGALGGALGGAGAGGQIAGPIGSVIGGILGAIAGGILGQKNAQVTANINQLNTTFANANQAFALNVNNMNQQMLSLTSLLDQARAMQASSKKGSAQYQQVIDQYIQQINALQVQQQQTIRQMNEQLAILTEPVGAQQYLTTLQSILQQYQQFAGAASTTQELAQANQFLVQSLQQYEQTLGTQLLQDNTQAIQDALQLNDLLYQRTQLTLQYSQQVQSVLSEGVLTRQQTRAQSAGTQIELMNITYQRNLEQMNEQISATQYRVTAEQQIFNLAQTRIGLENQLVTVQEAQTNLDMERISALQGLVDQINSSNFGVGALGALLSSLQTVSTVGGTSSALSALLALFGPGTGTTPTTGAGTDLLETLAALSYQNRSQLGFGAYTGANITG